jgi:hypothetical protein
MKATKTEKKILKLLTLFKEGREKIKTARTKLEDNRPKYKQTSEVSPGERQWG